MADRVPPGSANIKPHRYLIRSTLLRGVRRCASPRHPSSSPRIYGHRRGPRAESAVLGDERDRRAFPSPHPTESRADKVVVSSESNQGRLPLVVVSDERIIASQIGEV